MKIKITVLLFILISVFIARPVNAAETSQSVPTGTQPQSSPTPTQAANPTSAAPSPKPASSETDLNHPPQPTPQVVNIPANSTSESNPENNVAETNEDIEQFAEPTPFIVPEHAEPRKSEQVYPQNITDLTPSPSQKSQITTVGIADSNTENPSKNLYASERLSPIVTRFLLIISGMCFVLGMVLFNFEKITKSTAEILPKHVVNNDPFFPSLDKV